MTRVALRKVKRSKTRSVWLLRWNSSEGKSQATTIGICGKMSKREAEVLQRDKQSRLDSGEEKVDKPTRMTLGAFKPYYLDLRRRSEKESELLEGTQRLAETTLTGHDMMLRYMVKHFGEDFAICKITEDNAKEFIRALKAGKLNDARKSSTDTRPISEQRSRTLLRNAKAIMNWAKEKNFVSENPFQKFKSKALKTDPKHHVPLADFEKLITAAKEKRGDGWVLLLSICRLAGLRLNEARTLPWNGTAIDSRDEAHSVGIDWKRQTIRVMGTHKGTDNFRFREVPICPRLYTLLREAADVAPDEQQTVTGVSPHNLTRIGQTIAQAAGLKVWDDFYNSLRTSCENDWKEGNTIAIATYTAWMGHSPEVSRKHYVSPLDSEFAAVTGKRAQIAHTPDLKLAS